MTGVDAWNRAQALVLSSTGSLRAEPLLHLPHSLRRYGGALSGHRFAACGVITMSVFCHEVFDLAVPVCPRCEAQRYAEARLELAGATQETGGDHVGDRG